MANTKSNLPPSYQVATPPPSPIRTHRPIDRIDDPHGEEPLRAGESSLTRLDVIKGLACLLAVFALSQIFFAALCTSTCQEKIENQTERELLSLRQSQEHERALLLEQNTLRERLREWDWKLKEEEQERRSLRWATPAEAKCTAYGVREYRAQLLNTAPYRFDWVDHCEKLPFTIHGHSLKTICCENVNGVSSSSLQPQAQTNAKCCCIRWYGGGGLLKATLYALLIL
ncbi:hypothetical protein HWV62_24063 [Athelia sp. TMB]|nr:hypothetical protein HWV62_24063 [Athelia sp. TMB]